jgi:hypothetical protein
MGERFLAPEAAADLRARISMRPFFIADRGRYHQGELVEGELFERLRESAERTAGAPLEVASHQWLRLGHGDYQLMRDDSVGRVEGRHLELILDFSEQATGQAEIFYSDGPLLAQTPLSLALVERHDSQYRYQRYLNHQVGDAQVFRLRLSLRFAR